MNLTIGAVLGLIAFTAAILLGMARDLEFFTILTRACFAFAAAGLLGLLFLGPAGVMIMQEAAGGTGELKEETDKEEKKDGDEEKKSTDSGAPSGGPGGA